LFSDPHKTHNTLFGQNVVLLNVELVVYIVSTGLQRVKSLIQKTSQLMLYRDIIAFVLRSTQNT